MKYNVCWSGFWLQVWKNHLLCDFKTGDIADDHFCTEQPAQILNLIPTSPASFTSHATNIQDFEQDEESLWPR